MVLMPKEMIQKQNMSLPQKTDKNTSHTRYILAVNHCFKF
jgi:hypothetical protein